MPRLSTIIGAVLAGFCFFYAADHQDEVSHYCDTLKGGFISSIHFG